MACGAKSDFEFWVLNFKPGSHAGKVCQELKFPVHRAFPVRERHAPVTQERSHFVFVADGILQGGRILQRKLQRLVGIVEAHQGAAGRAFPAWRAAPRSHSPPHRARCPRSQIPPSPPTAVHICLTVGHTAVPLRRWAPSPDASSRHSWLRTKFFRRSPTAQAGNHRTFPEKVVGKQLEHTLKPSRRGKGVDHGLFGPRIAQRDSSSNSPRQSYR